MRVQHRGFALVLVLMAAAAVFALALQGAVLSRAATLESRIAADRAEAERGARSAAAMVLIGLGTTVERFAQQTGSTLPPGFAQGDSPSAPAEEKPRIELPEMLKQMLGEKAREIEDEAKKATGADKRTEGGGITGRAGGARPAPRWTITSLPAEPVMVRPDDRGPVYMVTLADASALMNINIADRDQLIRYFEAKGLPTETTIALAGQIIDWRDADDFAEPFGAEQSVYRARGVICRNAPMESPEELKFLPAMTPEIYDLVRADLTVAGDGKVHLGTASREVLLSLPGMDAAAVDRLIEARSAAPITDQDLDRLLPIYARAAKERLKIESSGIIRFRVEAIGETRAVFEGVSVMSENGLRALGVRAVL